MILLGDATLLLLSLAALIIGLHCLFTRKPPLYFLMIISAVSCHILGHLYDVCELLTTGTLSAGFTIGYLGNIGCFLFLLTANYGYMDSILDDKTPAMRKSHILALLAPLLLALLYLPNTLPEIPEETAGAYRLVWLPAMFSSYFNLKHIIIPDMGFGFVRAIRPLNVAALVFTVCEVLHLTAWNFGGWIATLVTGTLSGASCILMILMAKRGVIRWTC